MSRFGKGAQFNHDMRERYYCIRKVKYHIIKLWLKNTSKLMRDFDITGINFFFFLHHFVLARLAISEIRVNINTRYYRAEKVLTVQSRTAFSAGL